MIYYTPAEIASRWKCSASHVRKMIDNGELPAFRIGGKLLRINQEDLEAYERRQSTAGDAKPTGTKAGNGLDGASPEAFEAAGARLRHAVKAERKRSCRLHSPTPNSETNTPS